MSKKPAVKQPAITWTRCGPSGYGGFIYVSNPEGYALHGWRDEDEGDKTTDYAIYQHTTDGQCEQVGFVRTLEKAKAFVARHARWVVTVQLQKFDQHEDASDEFVQSKAARA